MFIFVHAKHGQVDSGNSFDQSLVAGGNLKFAEKASRYAASGTAGQANLKNEKKIVKCLNNSIAVSDLTGFLNKFAEKASRYAAGGTAGQANLKNEKKIVKCLNSSIAVRDLTGFFKLCVNRRISRNKISEIPQSNQGLL